MLVKLNICIADIQISIRQLPMDIDTRKIKYISKLKLSKNKILTGLSNVSGYLQLTKLLSDYNMPDICHNFKQCLLDNSVFFNVSVFC